MMKTNINFGIIGCGDVTEKKSGPAFQKLEGSTLYAVMRRNEEKLKQRKEEINILNNTITNLEEKIKDLEDKLNK